MLAVYFESQVAQQHSLRQEPVFGEFIFEDQSTDLSAAPAVPCNAPAEGFHGQGLARSTQLQHAFFLSSLIGEIGGKRPSRGRDRHARPCLPVKKRYDSQNACSVKAGRRSLLRSV